MNPKKLARILKEIEESSLLVTHLTASGFDFETLCACVDPECQACLDNDREFFSDSVVRKASNK